MGITSFGELSKRPAVSLDHRGDLLICTAADVRREPQANRPGSRPIVMKVAGRLDDAVHCAGTSGHPIKPEVIAVRSELAGRHHVHHIRVQDAWRIEHSVAPDRKKSG